MVKLLLREINVTIEKIETNTHDGAEVYHTTIKKKPLNACSIVDCLLAQTLTS